MHSLAPVDRYLEGAATIVDRSHFDQFHRFQHPLQGFSFSPTLSGTVPERKIERFLSDEGKSEWGQYGSVRGEIRTTSR